MNIFHPGNEYIYLSHYSYVQMNSCIHEFRYSQIEVQLFMQLFANITIHVHALFLRIPRVEYAGETFV